MDSKKINARERIDALANAAKHTVDVVIDDARDVANIAAAKTRKHVHDAGERVKEVGEKILKMAD